MEQEDIDGNQGKVQLEVLDLIQAIPNQFCNPLPILCHLDSLPWLWRVAFQEGCQIHHWYHRNLFPRNYQNCQIQMCLDLEELNLKVVMMGVENRVEMMGGGKLWGGRESCGHGGVTDKKLKQVQSSWNWMNWKFHPHLQQLLDC